MEFFHDKKHPGQGCIKGGSQTGAGAGGNQYLAFNQVGGKMISENFGNGRSHLYGWSLSAQGKPAADSDDAADEFHKQDTPGTECKKSFQIPL